MVEKQGQKIRAGVSPPPPPFRAMPKRKHFFFREGFPNSTDSMPLSNSNYNSIRPLRNYNSPQS